MCPIFLANGSYRDVRVAAEASFLHVAVADFKVNSMSLTALRYATASSGVLKSGSLTISIKGTPVLLRSTKLEPVSSGVSPWRRFSGVLFHVDSCYADSFSFAFVGLYVEVPAYGERLVVLGYLVALGQVGVKVVFLANTLFWFILQFTARAIFIANSTEVLFNTGKTPGMPRHTGQVWVLGSAPNFAEQGQKSLDLVRSWAWTSSPITVSYFTRPPSS